MTVRPIWRTTRIRVGIVKTYPLFLGEWSNGWVADKRMLASSAYPFFIRCALTTRVITYTYDHLYRLTGADYSTGEQFQYAYDGVGNPVSTSLRGTNCRTVQTQTLTSTTVTTYTYDHANRLDYFYADGVQTDLTWDAANRLVSAEVEGVASAYEYDGLGNRVAQAVGGVTTEYVLDVAGGLPEVIVATTGGASTRYVQVQGQVLAQQDSGAWTHILPDHLGSVRQLVGSDSRVDLAQSFDPFGVLLVPVRATSVTPGSGGTPRRGCCTCGRGIMSPWWDGSSVRTRGRGTTPDRNR
jgi:YD repeat-containing protein